MQGIFIYFYNFVVALSANGRVFGRVFDKPCMGLFLGCGFFITLVAKGAAVREMGVGSYKLRIDEVCLVLGFRRDRRRRACSPDPFRKVHLYRYMEGFQDLLAGMALHASALGCEHGTRQESGYDCKKCDYDCG